jgi:membrane dipeptidase
MTEYAERIRGLIGQHPVVDVHSDYAIQLYRAAEEGFPDALSREHLPMLKQGGVSMEILTVGGDFDIDHLKLWETRIVRGIVDATRRQIDAHEDFHLVLGADDLPEKRDGYHFMFALEGIRCVEDLAALRTLHASGVRSVILTHNERNLAADGCSEPKPGGLSNFGRSIVSEIRALRMVLDLVHLSDPSFFDALDHYDLPPMVSHSNARALCGHRRNLTDEQIRMIGERGGVIGLNFLGMFIDAEYAKATPDRLVDHALHIADLIGPSSLALGPDYADYYMDAMRKWLKRDGLPDDLLTFIAGAEDVSRLPVFLEALLRRGFSETDLTGILGGNALRLYRQVFLSSPMT